MVIQRTYKGNREYAWKNTDNAKILKYHVTIVLLTDFLFTY